MKDKIVTHRAIRPADGKVICTATMTSRTLWMPFAGPPTVDSLHNWHDDLIFQTDDGDGNWHAAIILIRMRQVVVTTLDAFTEADSEQVSFA